MTGAVGEGRAEPLGVSLAPGGVNAAFPSGAASAVEFCIFDDADNEIARHRLPGRTGDVFHGFIPGIGEGTRYGLRVHGAWAPDEGHRCNPAKLLVDPWARGLDRPFALDPLQFDTGDEPDPRDSAPTMPKGIVLPMPALAPPAPRVRREGEVIYELHIRGFSKLNEALPENLRGTFAGLAHPASIDYLRKLGVTLVEIMPAMAWCDERHLPPLGLSNYWGYNPIAFLAPDPRLAPGGWPEVREAVEALREAGIGTLLDVVLNHSGESDELGPTLSLRGLDNAGFYRLLPENRRLYVNDAGCGNVLAAERPMVLRLMMDALRQWVLAGGVDGFRFDLATTIARRDTGFDREAPLLAAIAQDPLLRERIMIAEPWDLGWGGYQLGAFPAGWGEWNDRFRDTTRRFWRGDGGMLGEMATRLAGSADIFARPGRRLDDSVNYVTAHDGFTLADLVAYEQKRNHANGEQNHDGTDDNKSWNNGAEGPSDDPLILERRAADARALLATLILARGTPMLTMGDEAGRGQGGNNNAYAQDNAGSWLDWSALDHERLAFTSGLIALRAAHPALSSPLPLTGALDDSGLPDAQWLRADGQPMEEGHWHDHERRSLVLALYRAGSRVVLALNAGREGLHLTLPNARPGHEWHLCLDSQAGFAGQKPLEGVPVLPPRGVVLFAEAKLDEAARQRHASGFTLTRLASAAGIAGEWWEVDGTRHEVPPDTKRIILGAMGFAAGSEGEARDSLARLAQERDARPMAATIPGREGQPLAVTLAGPLAEPRALGFTLTMEDGETRPLALGAEEGEFSNFADAEGHLRPRRRVALPALPRGRHRLRCEATGCEAWLIIAPPSAHLPPRLTNGQRAFGVTAQLYAMRRTGDDQGIGDFTTLRRLGESSAREGAAVLGINPIHALHPTARNRASPYHPSDRLFLEPLYIDLATLPEPLGPKLALTPPAPSDLVDYPAVWALKRAALAEAYRRFLALPTEAPLRTEEAAFRAREGETLADFCAFTAIAEARGEADWRQWPAALRQPGAEARAAFPEGAGFHAFLQWLADRQLAEAASGSGLSIGFYRDLAVGCAPDGAEAWRNQGGLLAGLSVGAPPDPFSAEGQIWNLPAPNPMVASAEGHSVFSRLLAANMRHAGALRIDHVLALSRLFLVPEGAKGSDGAYLAYPFQEMIAAASLESDRAGCLLVGEDLGTVPPGIGEALQGEGLLSYRVLWFERRGEGFLPPAEWPAKAAACVATHDLPTLAGWWEGADIAERATLGLAGGEGAMEGRQAEKRQLLEALESQGLLPPDADPAGPLTPAIMAAIHRYVAQTPSLLALVQAEDLVGERVAVNLPGTDNERPNWRRRVETPVESLAESDLARAVMAAFRHEGR
ncbi:glycogen debranching protein GlgX [Acetobacteraceae bacterium H6797]|nr:glycogen debranching protein GlgX [Acetobacteraceae bacterium H6797]